MFFSQDIAYRHPLVVIVLVTDLDIARIVIETSPICQPNDMEVFVRCKNVLRGQ